MAPGAIRTDILQYAMDQGAYTEESIAEMFPMKKIGIPSDIARGVVFLVNSPYCTGTTLTIDGGLGAV